MYSSHSFFSNTFSCAFLSVILSNAISSFILHSEIQLKCGHLLGHLKSPLENKAPFGPTNSRFIHLVRPDLIPTRFFNTIRACTNSSFSFGFFLLLTSMKSLYFCWNSECSDSTYCFYLARRNWKQMASLFKVTSMASMPQISWNLCGLLLFKQFNFFCPEFVPLIWGLWDVNLIPKKKRIFFTFDSCIQFRCSIEISSETLISLLMWLSFVCIKSEVLWNFRAFV